MVNSERGNDTSIDLHKKITDLLMENFVPLEIRESVNDANYMLIHRGVSSIADDIVKLAEDTYGFSS